MLEQQSKVLVYVNDYLSKYFNKKEFKDLIKKKINTKENIVFHMSDQLKYFDDNLEANMDIIQDIIAQPSFFNGLCFSQLIDVRNGIDNFHINLAMHGLNYDFEFWFKLLNSNELSPTFIYVDITYDEYLSFVEDANKQSKEDYETRSDYMKDTVKELNAYDFTGGVRTYMPNGDQLH